MMITHKTEIFPDSKQVKQIEINFGLRRFYFNKIIMTLKHRYGDLKENKKLIKKKELMEYRSKVIRGKYKWLVSKGPSHILNTTIEDVQFALDSLWRKGKDILLRKKKYSNTFRIHRSGVHPDGSCDSFRIHPDNKALIRLPKLGYIEMAEELRWEEHPKTIRVVTIKKTANRYFIAITCEIPDPKPLPKTNKSLGIDWGLKTYITGFDGDGIFTADFDNGKLIKLDKRVARLNKRLARCILNSKNFAKVKTKLQQAYLNFVNYRHDFVHQLVHEINLSYDSVTLEGLGMKFVTQNKHLAAAARRKPFYLLKVALINKFKQYGKKVYLVNKTYPSTQTCYQCGYVKKGDEKMELCEHTYHCKNCGHVDDRDENAAKNLWACKEVTLATIEQ